MSKTTPMSSKPRVGISQCLTGDPVRYDGQHKRNDFLMALLSDHVTFVRFCPEVGMGMSVPRPRIQLVNHRGDIRLCAEHDETQDYTDDMQAYVDTQSETIDGIHGIILKSRSPSCGISQVEIKWGNAQTGLYGSGLFAHHLLKNWPLLPMLQETDLQQPTLRENFLVRLYVFWRWCNLFSTNLTKSAVIDFHTRHKMLLFAHNESIYRRLGTTVAEMPAVLNAQFASYYLQQLMQALEQGSNLPKQVNVMQHAAGYLHKYLSVTERARLNESIHAYRLQQVARDEPLKVFHQLLHHYPVPYLSQQYYFYPYPNDLASPTKGF